MLGRARQDMPPRRAEPAAAPATLVSPALAVPQVLPGPRARMRIRRPASDSVLRWSRFVKIMRLVLPAVALGMVVALVAWPFIFGSGIQIKPTGEVVMLKPRYTGTTPDNASYTVEAASARHVGRGRETDARVELTTPFAGVTLADGAYLGLRAAAGLLDQSKRSLELSGGVQLLSADGYRLETESASLSGENKRAYGDKPISAWGPNAHLTANGFRIEDKGQTLIFTGPAKLELTLPEAKPDPKLSSDEAVR